MLSAIGATPKQIKRSLRFEGLLIGLLGSVLGRGRRVRCSPSLLIAVLDRARGQPARQRHQGAARNVVVQGIFIGTLITFSSVMIPARRAAKTEPIEALRDAAVESSAVSRGRVITAARR